MIKEEVETKTQQIEKSSDPDLITAVSHVKALVSSIAGSPDTCGTSALSMLTITDLEKIEIVLASGNVNFKYEAIMKVLLSQDHATMKRKESLLVSEFLMLVSVTRLLLVSQFGSDKGEMSWHGKRISPKRDCSDHKAEVESSWHGRGSGSGIKRCRHVERSGHIERVWQRILCFDDGSY